MAQESERCQRGWFWLLWHSLFFNGCLFKESDVRILSDGGVGDGVGDNGKSGSIGDGGNGVGSGSGCGGDGEAGGLKVQTFKVQLYCHYHVQYTVTKFRFSI